VDIHRDAIMAAAKYQLVLQLHAVFSYRGYGPELFYLFDEIRDQIPPFLGVFIPVVYRTVAWLLGFNKNTVQRIFQLKGWQVRKRAVGMRPRIEAVPSVATAPNERWSTDLARVWTGKDGWASLALVIDCHTRELLGWHLSRSGKATTASAALEHALISRFGTLGRVDREFLLRSDNGLVFTGQPRRTYGLTSYRQDNLFTIH
jgi:transposase InsO family protein